MRVALVSIYDLGHQPFAIASAAAWLRAHGHDVTCLDVSVSAVNLATLSGARLIAVSLPMHTATRIAGILIPQFRESYGDDVHICCFGVYAALNAEFLKSIGVNTILGGEFEEQLASLADRLSTGSQVAPSADVALDRLSFLVPDRSALPRLNLYPKLQRSGGSLVAGYTEASRGCKHLCRHCPIVPVYNGAFRVVQSEVVLADVRQQVAAGATHITFGDPDFLNGPTHARRIVEAFHREFPTTTYDATIKIEHLLRHSDLLPVLRETGCLFITSAVESVQDDVLEKLEKHHTRADFVEAVGLCQKYELTLSPTFIPFTPWTTREGYADLLRTLADLGMIEAVSPVQLALRLLITPGSRLLELEEVQSTIEKFDPAALIYRWKHRDPAIDELAAQALRAVYRGQKGRLSRREIFRELWWLASGTTFPEQYDLLPRAAIPYMDEPWYC